MPPYAEENFIQCHECGQLVAELVNGWQCRPCRQRDIALDILDDELGRECREGGADGEAEDCPTETVWSAVPRVSDR